MSSIDNAKKAMGWLNANARAACGNCAQARSETTCLGNSSPRLWCKQGGFLTTRYAICDQHLPMLLTTGSVPK